MRSGALIGYEMSPLTKRQLQGQCDFLREASSEGSVLKTNLMGRVVLALSCVILHAEFFARCLLLVALAAVNCVVKFKKEQISIQARQAYTALSASALCFRTLFQSEMALPFEQWLKESTQEELPSKPHTPNKQVEPLAAAGAPIPSIISPRKIKALFDSEQARVARAVASDAAYQNTVLLERRAVKAPDAAQWMQEYLQSASKEAEPDKRPLDAGRVEGIKVKQIASPQYLVQSAFYNNGRKSEIQRVVDSFSVNGQEIRIISLLEPLENRPRAAVFVRDELKRALQNAFDQATKGPLDDGLIVTAFRRACYDMQNALIAKLSNVTLHEHLDPLADDCSSMTTVLIIDQHVYVFNVGGSRAILYSNGQCTALTTSADPTLPENQRRIIARGGEVKDARVNGQLPFATAFGGRRLYGAASGLNSVTKFPLSRFQQGDQIFLVTHSVYENSGREALKEFLNSLSADQEDPRYASLLLSAVAKTLGQAERRDLGCIVISPMPTARVVRPVRLDLREMSRFFRRNSSSRNGFRARSLSPLQRLPRSGSSMHLPLLSSSSLASLERFESMSVPAKSPPQFVAAVPLADAASNSEVKSLDSVNAVVPLEALASRQALPNPTIGGNASNLGVRSLSSLSRIQSLHSPTAPSGHAIENPIIGSAGAQVEIDNISIPFSASSMLVPGEAAPASGSAVVSPGHDLVVQEKSASVSGSSISNPVVVHAAVKLPDSPIGSGEKIVLASPRIPSQLSMSVFPLPVRPSSSFLRSTQDQESSAQAVGSVSPALGASESSSISLLQVPRYPATPSERSFVAVSVPSSLPLTASGAVAAAPAMAVSPSLGSAESHPISLPIMPPLPADGDGVSYVSSAQASVVQRKPISVNGSEASRPISLLNIEGTAPSASGASPIFGALQHLPALEIPSEEEETRPRDFDVSHFVGNFSIPSPVTTPTSMAGIPTRRRRDADVASSKERNDVAAASGDAPVERAAPNAASATPAREEVASPELPLSGGGSASGTAVGARAASPAPSALSSSWSQLPFPADVEKSVAGAAGGRNSPTYSWTEVFGGEVSSQSSDNTLLGDFARERADDEAAQRDFDARRAKNKE